MSLSSVTVVAGLPGSGKSTWCEKQFNRLDGKVFVIDDPSVYPHAWIVPNDVKHVIVADPHLTSFTLEDVREWLCNHLYGFSNTTSIKWLVFENDIEACLKRSRPRVLGLTQRLSKEFYVPEGVSPTPLNSNPLWEDLPIINGETSCVLKSTL